MAAIRLIAPLCAALALASCGSSGGGGGASSAKRFAEVAIARDVRIAAQPSSGAPQAWGEPVVTRARRGYVATFRSSASSAKVRLAGIGYPAEGTEDGATVIGPGVAAPWTTIAHGQYTVTVADAGRWVGLRVWSRGGQWRAKVDGRYVDSAPRPVGSDSAIHTIGVDLSRARGAHPHVVQFELRGGAWLAGVAAGAGDRLALPPAPRGPSIYWLGDSYFAGGGARYPGFSDLVHVASARLGLQDVTVDALGGTGYVQDNKPAKFADYLTRARKNIGKGRAEPDIVVVGGSINDAGQDPRAVAAGAQRLYAYLARADPRAKVVVVVFTPRFPVPAGFAALDRTVLGVAAKSRNVAGALDLPARVARSASGLQAPNGHPTQAGHDVYGRLIAGYLRSRLHIPFTG